MKKLHKITILFLLIVFTNSCNEDEILKEVPVDFLSPENSFQSFEDFNAAIYGLLDLTRETLSDGEHWIIDLQYGTDLGVNNTPRSDLFGDYLVHLNSSAGFVAWHWRQYYKIISSSNIILSRLQESNLSSEHKNIIQGNARFFRGLSYKNLAHLYGGVPIELDEVTSSKTDYKRSSRNEVYQQAVSDLEFASNNLPLISEAEDWQINNLAAFHLLAEAHIALKDWDQAIKAATIVIDDPNTNLMTERFGSRTNDPGDVYWDLFRKNNQNRSSGNTEAIMVFQYEVDVLGGVLESNGREGPWLERNWSPFTERVGYLDPDGIRPLLAPVSDYTGGRGIGRIKGTEHYLNEIWKVDWDDMRNSEFNMVRDLTFNNPNSNWYGQKLSDHPDWFPRTLNDSTRWFYSYPSKVTMLGDHPQELVNDQELGLLSTSAGATYTDQYFIRLAETYLLRAEAYLGKGELGKAASDINVVRSRANAVPVVPNEVDIDYILDERLRELGPEEPRRLTLQRLGLLHDRVKKYAFPTGFNHNEQVQNPGFNIQPHHNLWPIPFSEIERNRDAELEQNPGYSAN